MSRSVGKALPDDALQCPIGAREIVHAERLAGIVSEIELGEVAVQMLLGAVLIDANHPALEDAKDAFDGVGVDGVAHVLADRMLHGAVLGEELIGIAVQSAFVG